MYYVYAVWYAIFQLLTWVFITPIISLPWFRELRDGPIDNANGTGVEPRLKKAFAIFDTPDNSLMGDKNWKANNPKFGYWSVYGWLIRNSLYGYKWSVMAAPVSDEPVVITGNKNISYHGPVFGEMYVTSGKYWQKKSVKPIKWLPGYCLVMNTGWLIEDGRSTPSLWMLSPRLKKIDYR